MTIRKSKKAFSLLEISAVILIIGILIAGVMGGNILVAKTRIAAAQTLTVSSPIHGIKDSALWLETAVDTSFVEGETANNNSITTWYDARKSSANKVTITAAGTGPVYSNTINYIHAVKFNGSSSNYLQIADASFLNNTDYTIVILEKRQSNSANNYFFGESPTGTANQKLALGYSLDNKVIHAQGTNSYESTISNYSDSSDKPRIFTFVSDSSSGKKTYINGILAAESSDTTQLSGLGANFPIGKSYSGEIGEIAIFTRALKAEERKAVEDYVGKKFTAKVNRDSVAGGSCTTGTITNNGCSMDCSTAGRVGISTPSTITDGQTVSATCGQTGYNGNSVSLTCLAGNISGSACGCDTGNNYTSVGGVCVKSCTVSVAGSSITSVISGITQVACDAGGHYGSTPFTFSACSGTAISGTCACAAGYSGAGCNSCDSANNYISNGGNCVLGCTVTANNGVTSPPAVVVGSSTLACNDTPNYTGTMAYTCASNGTFSITTPCTISQTCSGGVIDSTSVPGFTIHKFTSSGTLTCPVSKSGVTVLVVGGGGGGSSDVGGGGGGGQVVSTTMNIGTSSTITVGAGGVRGYNRVGAATCSGNTGGTSSIVSGATTIQALGGSGARGRSGGANNASAGTGYTGGGAAYPDGTATGSTGTGGASYKGGDSNGNGGGGGGGAGGAGQSRASGAAGGVGLSSSITGTPTTYGGGGGGSGYGPSPGAGGAGGGGAGTNNSNDGVPGTDGLGGGGGGAGSNGSATAGGGTGGKGVVIIRYAN